MNTDTSRNNKGVADDSTPAYIRIEDIRNRYGLRRSFVYQLIKDGRLESICLRGRGKARGIRLFRPLDIERLIESNKQGSGS